MTNEPLLEILRDVRNFIEYARYELQPGEMQFGDQFPRQGCADKRLAKLDEAIALLASAPSAPQPTIHKIAYRCFNCGHTANIPGGRQCPECRCTCTFYPASQPSASQEEPTQANADTCDDLCMLPVDPLAAAVNAQLDPLKDALIAMGRKLAREETR